MQNESIKPVSGALKLKCKDAARSIRVNRHVANSWIDRRFSLPVFGIYGSATPSAAAPSSFKPLNLETSSRHKFEWIHWIHWTFLPRTASRTTFRTNSEAVPESDAVFIRRFSPDASQKCAITLIRQPFTDMTRIPFSEVLWGSVQY